MNSIFNYERSQKKAVWTLQKSQQLGKKVEKL
jgi:hypothetical protein